MTWWHRQTHADRRPLLLTRNRIQTALRGWFLDQGFVEVDPACLVVSPGNETHLHALETTAQNAALIERKRYLHTSPEFAMKKLIAAGETKIFSFAHVWRDRESGPRHATEFTMLEWYRTDAPYTVLMEDCGAILTCAASAAQSVGFHHRDNTCRTDAAPLRVTLPEAFAQHGLDLLATLPKGGDPDAQALAAQCDRIGLSHQAGETWSDLFSRILTALIEPGLPAEPTFLDAYPAPEAALARRSAADPRLAERFELFCCGLELANAFGELTDPIEQRARFTADMQAKRRLYGAAPPLDEELLAALEHMPPTCGAALGFDRLVMLATGAPQLIDVQWTPHA